MRLNYTLAPASKSHGSNMSIVAPTRPRTLRIVYVTSPQASGLQWLTAAQTAEKKLPFMFSQSDSTHARSWIPLQVSAPASVDQWHKPPMHWLTTMIKTTLTRHSTEAT